MAGREQDDTSLTALDLDTVADAVESGPLNDALTAIDEVLTDANEELALTLEGVTYMRWKRADLSDGYPGTSVSFRTGLTVEEIEQAVPGFPPDMDGFSSIEPQQMVSQPLLLRIYYDKTYPETVLVETGYEAISVYLPTEDAVQDELDGMSLFD